MEGYSSNSYQEFIDRIDGKEFTSSEKKQLLAILRRPLMVNAFRLIKARRILLGEALMNMNFDAPGAITQAARLQGECKTLDNVPDYFIQMIEDRNPTNEEEEE